MISIQRAIFNHDLQGVYQFRYQVYVDEMKQDESYANHTKREIVDPLDTPNAVVLAAWSDGEIVATSRYNLAANGDLDVYADYYKLDDLPYHIRSACSISTRTMIRADYRRTTLTARLCCRQYLLGLMQGVTTDFCDCAPGNIPFFEGLGYRIHLKEFIHPEFGAGPVMRLDLHDLEHLEQVRSPFRRYLREWRVSQSFQLAA